MAWLCSVFCACVLSWCWFKAFLWISLSWCFLFFWLELCAVICLLPVLEWPVIVMLCMCWCLVLCIQMLSWWWFTGDETQYLRAVLYIFWAEFIACFQAFPAGLYCELCSLVEVEIRPIGYIWIERFNLFVILASWETLLWLSSLIESHIFFTHFIFS